mgnify:FL=1
MGGVVTAVATEDAYKSATRTIKKALDELLADQLAQCVAEGFISRETAEDMLGHLLMVDRLGTTFPTFLRPQVEQTNDQLDALVPRLMAKIAKT